MKLVNKVLLAVSVLFSASVMADDCPNINIAGKPVSSQQYFDICRDGYAIGYNFNTKSPAWVAERLTRENLEVAKGEKKVQRTNNFRPDPLVPSQYSATLNDYRGSGYDRGHMAPAEDFRTSEQDMSDSFYLSNIIPQNAPLNRGTWATLEKMMRYWAQQYGEILVVTGPIYYEGKTLGNAGSVPVPTHLFKAVYIPQTGKSIAFVLPNQQVDADQIPNARSSVNNLGLLTGINFFPNVPESTKSAIADDVRIFTK